METKLKTTKHSRRPQRAKGNSPTYDVNARPLWEIACELSALVPEEELTKIPADASANLHHYLYGAPRVEQ